MGLIRELGGGQGYLKAGFLGFQGSGKTWTAVSLALGVRRHFGLTGPIAFFDTESGSEYVAPRILAETGKNIVGVRSQTLDDLIETTREAEAAGPDGVSVLIADSMTHVWREVCAAYLKRVNEVAKARNKPTRTRMEFQDWAPIKERWKVWTDLYLNTRLHIIIAGRAGYEYDFEEREDGSGKDLLKTGIKMKTEGEFGFEPSLLTEMERIQAREDGGKLKKVFVRRASVLKDRFGLMDASQCDNPGFDFFLPHVQALTPGAHAPVDTEVRTDLGIGDDGDSAFRTERRLRVILCEKIQAAIVERWPGQTASEKKAKSAALKAASGTTSWTEVETKMDSEALKRVLETIEAMPAEVANA